MQLKIDGAHAISKIKGLVGQKDPAKNEEKDSLRSFYGVDRVDNAFFVSELIREAQIEFTELFTESKELTGKRSVVPLNQ